VVADIERFLADNGPYVATLLATRDVAYAQAAKLGWPELRLAPPEKAERTVAAVLSAAAERSVPVADRQAWVNTRKSWVAHVLSGDQTLRETPLLPVLLGLLAAERHAESLPQQRATILYEVVRNVAERREVQRQLDFALGDLTGRHATAAALEQQTGRPGHAARGGSDACWSGSRAPRSQHP
jgi:hypothetical protein